MTTTELTRPENPIAKFLEWKGGNDKGYFQFYNKETGQNEQYELGEFEIVKVGYVIKGWNDKFYGGMYSNEINNFSEPFKVLVSYYNAETDKDGNIIFDKDDRPKYILDDEGNKVRKIKALFEGRYNKTDIEGFDGKLHISITARANGELVNLTLKGMTYYNFNTEILDKINWGQARFDATKGKVVEYTGAEAKKKGSVKYKVPTFKILDKTASVDSAKMQGVINQYFLDNAKYNKAKEEEYAKNKGGISDEENDDVLGDALTAITEKATNETKIEDVPF